MSSSDDFNKMAVGKPCTVCVSVKAENTGTVYVEFNPMTPLMVQCDRYPNHNRPAKESEAEDFWVRNAEIRG